MPEYDRNRIEHLEDRLAMTSAGPEASAITELEMLADLYLQADSYTPALETIERLLSLPSSRALSPARRAALESKAVDCRLAHSDCQAAIARCREALADEVRIDAPSVRARLHLQWAEALLRLGRLGECRDRAQHGLEIADSVGDLSLAASGINLLGRVAYREGDLLRARDLYEQELALYRRTGDEARVAHVRNNLGLIHKNLCEWDAAIAHLRAALDIHRRAGRFGETHNPLVNLGIVYQKSGDWARALDHYRQAEQICLQIGDQLRLAMIGIGLGNVARLQRRFTDAESLLQGALEGARRLGARREEVLALEFLGELDFDRGRPEAALSRYHEALKLAEAVAPEGDLVVELERRRAEALGAIGRLDEADQACERSRRLARRIDDRLEHAVTHRVAGQLAWARGRRDEATQSWTIAASLLSECREKYELGRTLLSLGRAADDPRDARRFLYRASALFAELSASHWLDECESDLQRLLAGATPAPTAPGSLLGRRLRAPSLVACSPDMHQAENLAQRAAATDLAVLVTGETGTGKELIARTIHGLSTRSAKPFLAVNCGALRADLALSQLFGHRKGAFTGAHAEGVGLVEAAHGGTLFLDEVGELPADVQVTLLRFLESGEYMRLGETQVRRADVRVIAATNRDLRGASGERQFRRDLLFRLNEIEIRLPALNERREDILPLARHFLTFYGGLDGPRLEVAAESVLLSYSWPGNVRELENVMRRLAALHRGDVHVGADELLPLLSGHGPELNGAARATHEREEILSALRVAAGNKSRVAELLGVSRKTLYARIKRLGIELP
ncbi:MAG TPA: sigma 54-interacting transcriptional regulator [Candidatus Limnocylindria bacterium]|nr:sigma 54-interacting transcriptional regulator [Candidatus Limnocylindria bacterium]